MISASKTTFSLYNIKILRLKLRKSYEFADEVLWIPTLRNTTINDLHFYLILDYISVSIFELLWLWKFW